MAATSQRLNRSDLRELGRITNTDKLNAQEWWLDNAPAEYSHLFDSLQLSSIDEIPTTDAEFYHWLREMYPGTQEDQRRTWLRRLWGLGTLFFFVRGYYYNRWRGRVSPNLIRGSLDKAISNSRTAVMADCQLLRDGKISVLQWQEKMVGWIKATQIAGAISAAGGLSNISQAEWDIVNRNINEQLDYLYRLSGEVAGGKRDGTICQRMYMYLQSGRTTYHEIEQDRMANRGFTQYRNVLTPAEHCPGCLAETARGWVPVGDLVPIGARDCLTNDKCYYQYRNPITGEIDDRG